MATPQIDLILPEPPSTAIAGTQAICQGRAGSIRRAAAFAWYCSLVLAAVGDTAMTGKPAAILAALFVGGSVSAFYWAGQLTPERAVLRSLLVGVIGLAAGAVACAGSPPGSALQAEFLCFGAMSMFFGILTTLPMAFMGAETSRPADHSSA
jgi:hypothetical protein